MPNLATSPMTLRPVWLGLRIGAGLCAGVICGMAILALDGRWNAIAGAIVAICFAVAFRPAAHAYAESTMTGAAMGIPLWALLSVFLLPSIAGQSPQWTSGCMLTLFPQLIDWTIYGGMLGLTLQALNDVALRLWGPELRLPAAVTGPETRIVVLGGGFAGRTVTERLERLFGADRSVSITLVSDTNALVFTPMLAEVAGSCLEPSHISTPLRSSLHRTNVVRGRVCNIDVGRRRVAVKFEEGSHDGPTESEIEYDHVVLALGAQSNYLGLENVKHLAFDFKSLMDAIRIRNHVIEMFERADREPDAQCRKAMLTFVVAGGGFAGAEIAGALNDFARGILADYPSLGPEDVEVVLVHARDRILPELSEKLARYALEKMIERGVRFELNARVADAQRGLVILNTKEIRAQTLVWTAGTAPNSLVKTLPVNHDKRGAILVNQMLAVPDYAGMWALGDCASVTDAKSSQVCPPTAQFALREAHVLAGNIFSSIRGKPLKPFHFDSLGALCVVGHQTACAELTIPFARHKSMLFSGLLAWLMWRAIYWAKLPGLERKVRVLIDWIVELFFPRDIVQTIEFR